MLLMLEKGQKIAREEITSRLVDILYERHEGDFKRGAFRVRGDVIEIFPTYDDFAYRISLWGDEIESLEQIDPLTGPGEADLSAPADLSQNALRDERPDAPGRAAQHRKRADTGGRRSSTNKASGLRRSASGSAPCSIWK